MKESYSFDVGQDVTLYVENKPYAKGVIKEFHGDIIYVDTNYGLLRCYYTALIGPDD